ncbi:MAG: cytidine deaminase [Ferrovibrionaceae bacterium]
MDPELLAAARAVRRSAYAPYSRLKVGAALRDERGRIHVGCNVENAAYPLGTCAEAGAIAAMIAAGGKRFQAVAIVGNGAEACAPCGGCRQRLYEFGLPGAFAILAGASSRRVVSRPLVELLPLAFGPHNLVEAS